MHEPGKYKVHDAGLQAWLRYQKIQPLYWERDEHGVPLLVYEKTSMLMEMVRMYWERNGKYLPKDPPETWYDTFASIGRKPSQRETL